MNARFNLLALIAVMGWTAAIGLFIQNHKFSGAIMDELYTVESQCGIGPGGGK